MVSAGLGLDDAALRELGDPAAELRLDDLREAGWQVSGPRREGDGLTWVRASKPFADPDHMARVAAELSGPDGPFREFRLTRSRSLLETVTAFRGVVDLTGGAAGLSDADLEARLDGASLPLDPGAVRDGLRVRVEARLPGTTEVWEPAVGEQVTLEVRAATWNVVPLLPAAVAVLAALGAIAISVSFRPRKWPPGGPFARSK